VEELLARPTPPRSAAERLRAWVVWFGLGRLVAIAVSVALVGAGGYWLVAPPPDPVEASLPMAAGTTTTIASLATTTTAPVAEAPPVEIVVHVAGAVAVPGVHRLATDARVADAVLAAGGLAPDAHTDAINLAAPVRDGDRVYVPRVSDGVVVPVGVTGGTGPASAGESAGPVSINEAGVDELDALPGVGPATAAAIVAHREANGPFASIDSLGDVRGIGPAKLEAIRPLVSL
jgi:competence protein ComEA